MYGMYIHEKNDIHAYTYIEERITDACLHRPRVRPCVRARVRVCLGAPVSAPKHAGPFRRHHRVWLGSQAFRNTVFNADIGAWNTSRVTSLPEVCAALGQGPADAHCGGRARPGLDVARPLCAAALPMQSHVLTLIGTRLRGCSMSVSIVAGR
jgi:hypothetical protein